jgi:TetR/AcrR family transcriptional regulator, transcriptional repressor for nem operon
MLDQIHAVTRSHSARRAGAQTTRERLLQAGLRKVLESGWAATGIDAVLRECAVPKGSFYHYFASKEAFGFALLESYQTLFMQRLTRWFVAEPPQSLAMLHTAMDGFLAESVDAMEGHQYQRGCLVGALGQEVASLHEGFRIQLLLSLGEWEKTLSKALFNSVSSYLINSKSESEKTQKTGLLQARCDAWARDFWVAWEGAVLHSLLARNPDALRAAVQRSMEQLANGLAAAVADLQPAQASPQPGTRRRMLPGTKRKKSKKPNEINGIQSQLNF